jgi:hypothetical protein
MRDLLREPIDAVLDEAGALVDSQSARLDTLRQRLSRDELALLEGIVASVAGDVDAWRARLEEIDADRILDVAQSFARRRGPWAFAVGGAALGFVAWSGLRRAAGGDVEGEVTAEEIDDAAPDDAADG